MTVLIRGGRAVSAYRPPELAEEVAERGQQQPQRRHSPGAVAQIDASQARLGKRYEWGHIDEAAYLSEHARITQQREELSKRQSANSPPSASRWCGFRRNSISRFQPQVLCQSCRFA